MARQLGPTLPISEEVHKTKYRGVGESYREAMNRVAWALKDDDEHFHNLRNILLEQRFMPAGRVQAAMGSTRYVTAYNCFVSGTVKDSFVDPDGIMDRAKEAATTMRMGGGIGYDFSTLRPRGELIKTLQSRSSGPVSFMGIYNEICLCTSSAGHRRGAQMGILRVDHPDVEEFIHAKQNEERLRGFNISLGITDEFMRAVRDGTSFDLRWGGRVYKTIDARTLWEVIMRSTWDWAEPGVIFIDAINRKNNLWYCETISATNPCGEQPLPPFGACLLGSFNLVKYVKPVNGHPVDPRFEGAGYYFDIEQLRRDVPKVVRAMDNVIDQAIYPLADQRDEAIAKRRMGLGVTGVANALETLGYLYGDTDMVALFESIMATIAQFAYEASAGLAAEKGAFPMFDRDKYLQGQFIRSLPKRTQEMISKYGIRNSHLLSIAPTGTISLSADNVSSGIEPVFSTHFHRQVGTFDGFRTERVDDYAYRFFGTRGRLTEECSIDHHLRMLIAANKYVDSSVSKTCNVSPMMPWEEFKRTYMDAWLGDCKGCTTFNPGGRRMGILTNSEESDGDEEQEVIAGATCVRDPETGKIDCD